MKSKLILSLACLAILSNAPVFGDTANWSIVTRIHIGGKEGWDYVAFEPGANHLFVSHGSQVVVLDTTTNSIIGSIAANGVHGIALAPDLKRGFISNGSGNNVTVFDLTTLKVLATLPAENNPDAICYEPATHRVFAFNGKSGTATVIDAANETVLGKIPLEGKPEFAVADGQGSVFNALEDKSQILKINAATQAIDARWNLPKGSSPCGMAIDPAHERLFIGCRNQTMVVMDGVSGKVIASLPIGKGVDACVYDAVGSRAFASCGDGTMTVVKQSDPDTYAVAETAITQSGARTMAFDPATGTAYLPTVEFAPKTDAAPGQTNSRPASLPDSFEILVLKAAP